MQVEKKVNFIMKNIFLKNLLVRKEWKILVRSSFNSDIPFLA